MKIRQIDVYKKDLGNAKPYSIAYKVVDEVWNVIVRVTLENGMSGLGACNPSSYVVNEDVDKAYQTLSEENISFLIGRDIRSFYALVTEVQANFSNGTGARTALDIALHDVFTKYLEVPLGSFLGQKIQSLPTSVTIGIMNVDKTLEEAREFYETGFRILKVKIGNELEEDVARIARLREVHGDNVAIR
ncbi:MAG: dipeptide epimerase, partial [Bacteroidota bacterium]